MIELLAVKICIVVGSIVGGIVAAVLTAKRLMKVNYSLIWELLLIFGATAGGFMLGMFVGVAFGFCLDAFITTLCH